MALNAETVERLIDQLAKDRQAFIDNTKQTNDLLQQTLLTLKSLNQQQQSTSLPTSRVKPNVVPDIVPIVTATGRRESIIPIKTLTKASQRTTTADIEVVSVPKDSALSDLTGDSDSETDDKDSIFVQTPLQPEEYSIEGLRNHLWSYEWSEGGRAILCGLQDNDLELAKDTLFPSTEAEAVADRSHLSHYSIYDVGFDGVPLDVRGQSARPPTRALEIWDRICTTNVNTERRPAAGRIIIVREPSPKLFAALHYTMNKHFDMDEMFDLLKDEDPGLMFPHRAFDKDTRHRRTFVITMEYFTIIGENCKPMRWQSSDEDEDDVQQMENHIPITRCSSVIALSLEGPPITKVKNRDRRIHDKYGDVFDPFSPWRVLSIQAYPDWHATTDTHKPTSHYVNGPEAFLYTVEAELEDARKRLKEVYNRVGELVEPPHNFIFNSSVREKLLFEDDKFTYSKKYFWAYQTLSIINQDITEMIESYRDTFRDSVWDGTNKIIWPGEATTSSRYQHLRKRMAKLRAAMDDEVEKLEYIKTLNSKKMQDIEALRENLFSGTSVMESRRSVEQTHVTIEQNRSVLLLTLVTIFFLPLTFVTSVFGMTNMDPAESYGHLAWAMLAICIPTYMLIGSLHSDAGLNFWKRNKRIVFQTLGKWSAQALKVCGFQPEWTNFYQRGGNMREREELESKKKKTRKRASSATRTAMDMRMRQPSDMPLSPALSRVESREKRPSGYPRPQLTSGDARFSSGFGEGSESPIGRVNSKTRPNEVTFSIKKLAVKQRDDLGSISPRTVSPRGHNAERRQQQESDDSGPGVARRFFHRLWGGRNNNRSSEKVQNRRPSV